MSTDNDIDKLKSGVLQIIHYVQTVLEQLKPRKEQQLALSLNENQNFVTNKNLHTNHLVKSMFTFDDNESSLLDQLTHTIQNTLNSFLPLLSYPIILFLKDFFHRFNYDFDYRSFIAPLKASILYIFYQELNGLLLFVKAFQDIFNGHLDGVINLIENYPMFKNRPGPFLTTLLYSAAKNGSIDIVKYLVEIAKCSLNSQNRRTDSNDNSLSSTPGSTALHAAASVGDRDLIAYLVEHGADIYVRNQAGETPLMKGMIHSNMKQCFEDCLIIGYSKAENLTQIAVKPITNGYHPQQDCFWEYMPIDFNSTNYQAWHPFLWCQSDQLQDALLNAKQTDISLYLNFSPDLYSIDTSKFLLTQRFNHNSDVHRMAWIRCRGSSRSNMWQILLAQHYECKHVEQMISTLEFEDLPRISNTQRNLRLNTWYFCDAKTNLLLGSAINSRRKQICIDVTSIGDKLIFNLFDFAFYNTSRTILGYIRWLPKSSVNAGEIPTDTLSNEPVNNEMDADISYVEAAEVDDCDEFDMVFEDEVNESETATNNLTSSLQNSSASANMPVSSTINRCLRCCTSNALSGYEEIQQYLEKISHEMQSLLTVTTTSTSTRDWFQYKDCFLKLLQQQINEYQKALDTYIITGISDSSYNRISLGGKTFQMELKEKIDSYLKNQPINIDINRLKRNALDTYIEEFVRVSKAELNIKYSKTSAEVFDYLIAKVKYDFETNLIHNINASGKEFETLPNVLKRIQLFYRCFLLQLPLYESAKELLNQIESNTVCTVATTTGSGKSILLPVLLIANDYPKVIITQPRRLACALICNRINQTMVVSNRNEPKLAGWYVSSSRTNIKAPILYMTDGLMKEYLLNDDDDLLCSEKNRKPTVFIIEVHERNVNTDLCIALFHRLLIEKPSLRQKIKLVLTSSSIDESISKLFNQVQELNFFSQFIRLTMPTPYPITEIKRPNENLLDVVQELYKKKSDRHDQILCFVSSIAEVQQSCQRLAELSHGAIVAYPLIQSQSIFEQQKFIEHGSVFFSTTVAEMSLTFPSLAYIIDTGMINMPVYDLEKKQTVLKEIRATEITIKQRMGRLGRTKPGEYYSLYSSEVDNKINPIPQICQIRLTDLEFILRSSHLKMSLKYFKQHLPDPPVDPRIQSAIDELSKSDILTAEEMFTPVGIALSKLPNFGSINMTKAVYAALTKYNCGGDLILLSSFLHVLNTSTILKKTPVELKSADGDFMTLINLMERLLIVKQSFPPKQYNLHKFCQLNDLSEIEHLLERALKRLSRLETFFNLSDEYREKAQMKTGNWSLIAKSLLEGYEENIFVSLKNLQGPTHSYISYRSTGGEIVGALDLQSTLIRPINMQPVSIVLARDVYYSSAIRDKAIICFVGEIKTEWITNMIERRLELDCKEVMKLQTQTLLPKVKQMFYLTQCYLAGESFDKLILNGPGGAVIEAELYIRQQLTEEFQFQLLNKNSYNSTEYKNFNNNLAHMSKLLHIFNPMIWRWEIQKQVKISVDFKKVERSPQILENACEVTVEGRISQYSKLKKEFDAFCYWLKDCSVMRHPNSGVPPHTIKPQLRGRCLDIEERIARVTDSKRSSVDLWSQLTGLSATRETRMEAVAWIAVCKFHCHLEGGFIRDWVVGHCTARPKGEPSTWLDNTGSMPSLVKELIPSDLDCHLPTHYYFDIEKFLDYLHKYRIECTVHRQDWRYIVVLDRHAPTGPFTMDLIEPHVALTHDRIDFDVNNLYLEKDYTHELGMRVDITQKPYNIKLETIIDNIKNKTFQILRPVDKFMEGRVDKMKSRGWTQIGDEINVIPNPSPRYNVVLVKLPKESPLYKVVIAQMGEKIPGCQVRSIEEIKNPLLEDVYLAMKTLIAKTCKGHNPNERELFHGTSADVIDGILNDGFDDRYFSRYGLYGHGAYFADNPQKSHNYTQSDPIDGTRVIIYSKVLLGKQLVLSENNCNLLTAPVGYHSILGKHCPEYPEYVVYRYGQALPYLKIIYKTT